MQAATARAGRASSTARIAFTVPSRAFTDCPSAPTIDLGREKKARYSSHGTSAIRSGAGGICPVSVKPATGYPATAPPAAVDSGAPAGPCAPPPGPEGTEVGVLVAGDGLGGVVEPLRSGSDTTLEPRFTLK